MEPAVFVALQSRLRDWDDCLAEGGNKFARWRVSGEILKVFQWGLDPEIPVLRETWAAAREAHYAAVVDIFGVGSAEVSAVLHQTSTSPFASPVSAPVTLSPQPAFTPKLNPPSDSPLNLPSDSPLSSSRPHPSLDRPFCRITQTQLLLFSQMNLKTFI